MSREQLVLLFSKEKMLSILRNPQQSPKETVLLLGMIFIVILIFLTLIAILTLKSPKRKKRKTTSYKKWLFVSELVAVLVFILFTVSLIYTSQPRFCKSCHQTHNEYSEWKTSTHREVSCVACHQEPGVFGFIAEKFKRIDDTISTAKKRFFATPYPTPVRAAVSNSSCGRCHSVERGSFVRNTIRVRHKDILEAGYKCTDCHNTVAHEKSVPQPKYPSMDKCILCHDNKSASAKCSQCHVPDVGKKPRKIMDYPKIHLAAPFNCQGCHNVKKCNECHGLEMPHPVDWDKKHPRDGFLSKQVCWKCHDMRFCQECHSRMPAPHPDNFLKTHGKDSEVPGSCACHDRERFCPLCHEEKK